MKNHEFQELVDQNLSGLVWDERKRREVLCAVSEEEKPVKKLSTTFILIAAIVCISVTALAAGLIFSNRVSAQQLAEKAVYDKYGVTDSMLSAFFTSYVDEEDKDHAEVEFAGWYYVLGNYKVKIDGGKTTVTWSHDGEDTSGMFEANAWGPEQMTEMIEMVKRDHGSTSFHKQAEAIAAKLNAPEFSTNPRYPEGEAWEQKGKEEAMAAAKAAGRSEADLITLAKDAIAERYQMTPEQRKMLKDPYEDDPEDTEVEDSWVIYSMEDGKPIFQVRIRLQQDPSGSGDLNEPMSYVEKDGYYWVSVNAETGVIEDFYYESDLAGNG